MFGKGFRLASGLIGRSMSFIKLKGRHLSSDHLLLINLNGINLIAPFFGFYAYALVCEPLSVEYVKELFKLRNVKRFLDIGAGIGTYSILVSKIGGFCTAIEPDPFLARLIEINAKLNNVVIEVYRYYITDYHDTNVRPLDSLGVEADVIKIDVDGAELSVIRGGIDTIRKAKYVLIEMREKSFHESHKLMKSLGFKPIFIEHLSTAGFINKYLLKSYIMPNDFNVLYKHF